MKTKKEINIRLLAVLQLLNEEYNKNGGFDNMKVNKLQGERSAIEWVLDNE